MPIYYDTIKDGEKSSFILILSYNCVMFACHRRDLLAKIVITPFLLASFELLHPL